jgi:hypothetical protein
MSNKSCCNPVPRPQRISFYAHLLIVSAVFLLACAPPAFASGDAPPWMHALVNAPLPVYDEKTDAVLLYADTNLSVQSADKIKIHVREAYKILRPGGRDYGTVAVFYNSHRKVTSLHGWCIPAKGQDFEVKDKDALDIAMPGIPGSELISDVKDKLLRIPAPDPGNIIGYEYDVEEQPLVLQETWFVQEPIPVREAHFTLQLPPSWEYKASWLNHPEVQPQAGGNQWNWTINDLEGIRLENEMPPIRGIAAQMIVSFFPPGGRLANEFSDWRTMGDWYRNLTRDRRDASSGISQKVAALTAADSNLIDKMRALADFLQHNIRYVAIELGIGGLQPHSASETFANQYGDCKDKATLMSSMLNQIGVDSYYVIINSRRGSVQANTPARVGGFDHAIVAIKLPDSVTDPSLIAVLQHPKLGRLLFFDPTDQLTPFGQIRGHLQSNYGLLVTPDGGALVELPMQPASTNSIDRTAKLTLEPTGRLQGEVKEVRVGDRASNERWTLRTTTNSKDQIKLFEQLLSNSLSTFQITHASIVNLDQKDRPFGFNYSFVSENYAKTAGDLLLVRPRVIGSKSSPLLETKEPRKFAIEFDGPVRDTDTFEIALPPGYQVDDLPPAVDADYPFASYHSKTESREGMVRYTRTFEIKELSVPVSQAADLKSFYRTIATDERNTVVLKASPK